MTDHDTIRDLLAPVALGAAEPHEEVLVEAHLATCAGCRAELEQLTATATMLALDVPPADPPPELRRTIMGVVEREAELRARRRVVPEPRTRRAAWFPRRAGVWPALAGGLAAVCIGLLAWGLFTSDAPVSGGGVRVEATAQTGLGGEGYALVLADRDAAVVQLTDLPELTADHEGYELWAIEPSGAPRSVGFMAVSPAGDGRAYAVVEGLGDATTLAVTREKLSNTAAPTENPIVTVPLDA